MLSDQSIHGFLLLAPVFIVSLTLHELAHGLTAYKLGDRTAKDMGRLTLNPIAHMDPLGSLILVLTYFGGSFLFGWAKPVPVDPRNLRTSLTASSRATRSALLPTRSRSTSSSASSISSRSRRWTARA